MYSSAHTAVGTAIMAVAYKIGGFTPEALLIGGFFAYMSHKPVDLLGEFPYGDIWRGDWKQTVLWEAVPFIAFLWIFSQSALWPFFAIGLVLANGMDLIDKGWRVWKGNTAVQVHSVRPIVKLTSGQTKLLAVLSVPFVWLIVQLV